MYNRFIIVLAFFLFSCALEDKKKEDSIEIDLSNLENIEDSLMFNTSDFIVLKSDKPLGKNKRFKIEDERIFYHDSDRNSLYIFKINGQQELVITATGKGENEFISLYDFAIESNGNIIIYDNVLKKLVYYNCEGIPISECKINISAEEFEIVDKNIFWFGVYKPKASMIGVSDRNGQNFEPLFSKKSIKNSVDGYFASPHIRRFNQMIIYTPYLSDTIFSFSNNEIMPFVHIKRKIGFSTEQINETGQDYYKLEHIQNSQRSIIYEHFLLTNDIIYFDFYGKRKGYSVFYSKNNSVSKVTGRIIINGINHHGFQASYNEKFYSIIQSTNWKDDKWEKFISNLTNNTKEEMQWARLNDRAFLVAINPEIIFE